MLYLDLDMISSFRYYIKKEILYFDLTVVLYCLCLRRHRIYTFVSRGEYSSMRAQHLNLLLKKDEDDNHHKIIIFTSR